jgi:hypothetical protein
MFIALFCSISGNQPTARVALLMKALRLATEGLSGNASVTRETPRLATETGGLGGNYC